LESKIVGELYVDGMAEKAAGIIQDAILGCKDDTIEGKLVALCDLLEAMWYLTEERVRGNHNKWIDEVYQQLIEMITVSNNNLKEPLIDDIKDYLTKSFGTIVTVNWSDILGGGYDKGMSKEAHSRCNTRKHGATRIARQKKSRRRSRSTKNI